MNPTELDLCNKAALTDKVATIDKALKKIAQASPDAKRLRTMPGVGPITAVAIEAFCPPAKSFDHGRGFAAWLRLVPRQNSTGGKERLGRITKMGQRDIRRLLVTGAMSVISASERRGRSRVSIPEHGRDLPSRQEGQSLRDLQGSVTLFISPSQQRPKLN